MIAVFLFALDAIEPPPRFCPPGKTGVSSHSGSKCVENAPSNCPPGWRGLLGGKCTLHPCKTDAACNPDELCVEHAVCLQPELDEFYDWDEPRDAGPVVPIGAMAPRERRPSPITRYNALNLCAPDVACAFPSLCQKEKVCAPRAGRAKAYLGTNISPARVARTTAAPLTTAEAGPTETSAPLKRGCGGCSTALVAVFIATRRRR